ncbi:MAG: hypothetical protein KatS3mg110_1803 [Pirellulaceae bacterium]|nr:MAG: hypothetical protein KatS3mg110_1803 [Pirellulaceae bacterium]
MRTVASSFVLWSCLFFVAKALTESQAKNPPAAVSTRPAPQKTLIDGPRLSHQIDDRMPSHLELAPALLAEPDPEAPDQLPLLLDPDTQATESFPAEDRSDLSKESGPSVSQPVPHRVQEAVPGEPQGQPPRSVQPSAVSEPRTSLRVQLFIEDDPSADVDHSVLDRQPPDSKSSDSTEQRGIGERSSNTDDGSAPRAIDMRLTPDLIQLRDRLRDVLAYYIERPEEAERRSPWGVMHALIAYGVDTEITVSGRRVNAIGWLCWNGVCRGQQLMYLEGGELRLRVGPGVQGHEGQFLAMLAQSRVRSDYPMRVEGRTFTVKDLIEYEKRTCREGTELTFKLIGLAHYLDTDEKWTSAWGQSWDIPKLIREELAQPVIGAACGGTHRMMGFSYAVKRRQKSGRPITGQWYRAQKYVEDYHEYTFKLQNPDGSFSTNWFAGPGAYGTAERKLETTGHILEWLVYSLPDEQLTDPRVVKAVRFLTDLLYENLDHAWEIGPKGHALHALAIYDERLFGGQPGKRRVDLAQHRAQAGQR